MDKRVVIAHPYADTVAAMVIIFPIIRLIGNCLNFRWGPSVQVAILITLFGIVISRFRVPGLSPADIKSSKRAHKHDYPPPFWSAIIEIYLRLLGRSSSRRNGSGLPHAAGLPQIRYVSATSVGILLPEPSTLCFFVNGLLWTQLAYFDDRELVILYNLSKNSLYHIKAISKASDDVYELTVCTPIDSCELKVLESLGSTFSLSSIPSAQSHMSGDTTAHGSNHQNNTNALTTLSRSSSVSASTVVPHNATSSSSSPEPHTSDTATRLDTNSTFPSVTVNVESSSRPTSLSPTQTLSSAEEDITGHEVISPAYSSSRISLGDDAIVRPRKRFDIYEETLTSAQQLLDSKKGQIRKLRKDGLKKLASLRSEIESTTTKIATKRKSDERTRKRIQALKERVAQHRNELEKLSQMETVRQSPEVETLATKADMIQRTFESKKQGFDVSLRVWAELQRTKKSEITKLEQRCAKLSDRLEKYRRECNDRYAQQSKRIEEYINQIKEDRSARKMRRVRLESDFVEAIRKLDVQQTGTL